MGNRDQPARLPPHPGRTRLRGGTRGGRARHRAAGGHPGPAPGAALATTGSGRGQPPRAGRPAAPVPADGRTLGALTVIMATPRQWSQAEAQAISGYASILGRLLVTAADAAHQRRLAGQLQTALDSRIVIEQAKGVLMARKGLPSLQAFQLLRHTARSSSRKLTDVAAEIIATPHA